MFCCYLFTTQYLRLLCLLKQFHSLSSYMNFFSAVLINFFHSRIFKASFLYRPSFLPLSNLYIVFNCFSCSFYFMFCNYLFSTKYLRLFCLLKQFRSVSFYIAFFFSILLHFLHSRISISYVIVLPAVSSSCVAITFSPLNINYFGSLKTVSQLALLCWLFFKILLHFFHCRTSISYLIASSAVSTSYFAIIFSLI